MEVCKIKDNIFNDQTYFSYYFNRTLDTGLEFKFDGLVTFIYIKEGSLMVRTNKETVVINAGEMLFVPILMERRWEIGNCERLIGRVFCFRYWPEVDELDYPIQKIPVTDEIYNHFYEIPSTASNARVNSHYIWKAYRFLTEVQPLMVRNNVKHVEQIQKALSYMKENDFFTIPDLVEVSGMSKSRFYDAFLKLTGVSPINMKHRLQAYKAEFLLKETELSIEEITKKLGFLSTAHFRKVFHSHYGTMPPLKYRKMHSTK